jgi:chromosomal replication initiation ATPase DnaA
VRPFESRDGGAMDASEPPRQGSSALPRTDYLSSELGTAPKRPAFSEEQQREIGRMICEELDRREAAVTVRTGPISCRECKEAAAQVFGVTVEQISGNLKLKPVSQARQAAIWAAFHLTGQHLSEVARNFNRDHTTILYSVHMCERLCGINGDFADKVDAVRRALRRPD